MTDDDVLDIVIVPGAAVTEELTQQAADVLGRDLYQTRRLLVSKVPGIVARQADPQETATTVRRLTDLGLVAFSCRDDELRGPLRVFKAKKLTFAGEAIVFEDAGSRAFSLTVDDAFLVVKAIRHNRHTKEVIRKSKRLSMMGMLLTGGIPVKKTVEEKTFETTVQDERLLRLFAKDSADPCIEISQFGFNFSCLGADMAPSSLRNIERLAEKIKEFFPRAAYDDNLDEPTRTAGAPPPPRENVDVTCKLMYRHHAMLRRPSD